MWVTIMSDDGTKPDEQCPASLWLEGMPGHGNAVEHSHELSNGRMNKKMQSKNGNDLANTFPHMHTHT